MADSTPANEGVQPNAVTDDTDSELQQQTHRPLHLTKSAPAFRSMEFLVVQQTEMQASRSRSTSAPLSVAAVNVARELRKASDIFLKGKRGITRERRHTLGSILSPSIEKEIMEQLSMRESDEYLEAFNEGTPV